MGRDRSRPCSHEETWSLPGKRIDEDREPMDLKEREIRWEETCMVNLSQDSGLERPSFMLGKGIDQIDDGSSLSILPSPPHTHIHCPQPWSYIKSELLTGYKTFALIIQSLRVGIFLICSPKHPDRYRR